MLVVGTAYMVLKAATELDLVPSMDTVQSGPLMAMAIEPAGMMYTVHVS